MGQLARPSRGFAEPERNRRGLPASVLDAHGSWKDAKDLPGRVSELEHVPRHALDREILVDGSHALSRRIEHHVVVGVVRDGAAGSDGHETRPLPASDLAVDRVPVNARPATAAPRAEPLREHANHGVEVFAGQARVRIRGSHPRKQVRLRPFLARRGRDDLLREDVERSFRNAHPIELAAPDGVQEGEAFDQVVAR